MSLRIRTCTCREAPRARCRSGEAGFSLIELMVVVLIIGILVGIAALTFSNQQTSSRDAKAKANLRQVQALAQIVVVRWASVSTNR